MISTAIHETSNIYITNDMWFDRPTLHSFPLIPSNELSKPTLDKFTEIVRRKGIDLGGDFDVVVESHRDLTNHPSIEDVKQAVDGVVKTVMWRRPHAVSAAPRSHGVGRHGDTSTLASGHRHGPQQS